MQYFLIATYKKLGSRKSKNSKIVQINVNFSFYRLEIETLCSIIDLWNIFCLVKYLKFKLDQKLARVANSTKMKRMQNLRPKRTLVWWVKDLQEIL